MNRPPLHRLELIGDAQPPLPGFLWIAAKCSCSWTSGYYHIDEVGGKMVDTLTHAHNVHSSIRRAAGS